MKNYTIILQSDTYHDYNRDEYNQGEIHIRTSIDKQKCLDQAKEMIDDISRDIYFKSSSRYSYNICVGVNGIFVGEVDSINENIPDDFLSEYEELTNEANELCIELNNYEKERNAYWKEQYNIGVRKKNQERLEQERIREKAEYEKLRKKYG